MSKALLILAFLSFYITGNGQNVGIGTTTPGAKLEVVGGVKITDSINIGGKVRITNGVPGAGKVLTSDANGLTSWEPAVKKAYFQNDLWGQPAFVIPNNVETTLNFGGVLYNNNMSVINGVITVPDAGLYHFDVNAAIAHVYTNAKNIILRSYVNGNLIYEDFNNFKGEDMLLNAGDQVTFKVLILSGGPVTLVNFSRMSGHKVY